MKYIFIDPSGSFNEGKGHTGIVIIKDNDWSTLKHISLAAKDYDSRTQYWAEVMNTIRLHTFWIDPEPRTNLDTKVIIESFMIRTQGFLMGRMPETIQMIGALEYYLEATIGVDYVLQTPTQAKSRFKDETLLSYIPNLEKRSNGRYYLNGKQINDHVRDALKHLLYFIKYKTERNPHGKS